MFAGLLITLNVSLFSWISTKLLLPLPLYDDDDEAKLKLLLTFSPKQVGLIFAQF